MPATPLLNRAFGFSAPYFILMNSIIPGISFVRSGFTASIVMSRGPIPVPPVVKMRFALSLASLIIFCRASASSGIRDCPYIGNPLLNSEKL